MTIRSIRTRVLVLATAMATMRRSLFLLLPDLVLQALLLHHGRDILSCAVQRRIHFLRIRNPRAQIVERHDGGSLVVVGMARDGG